MTATINADYVSKVAEHDTKVTCMTCHRGKTTPNDFEPAPIPPPAPPPRPAGAPGEAPPAPAPTPQP
jgi:photosynthetic reaction center cytochrome c subunit